MRGAVLHVFHLDRDDRARERPRLVTQVAADDVGGEGRVEGFRQQHELELHLKEQSRVKFEKKG